MIETSTTHKNLPPVIVAIPDADTGRHPLLRYHLNTGLPPVNNAQLDVPARPQRQHPARAINPKALLLALGTPILFLGLILSPEIGAPAAGIYMLVGLILNIIGAYLAYTENTEHRRYLKDRAAWIRNTRTFAQQHAEHLIDLRDIQTKPHADTVNSMIADLKFIRGTLTYAAGDGHAPKGGDKLNDALKAVGEYAHHPTPTNKAAARIAIDSI